MHIVELSRGILNKCNLESEPYIRVKIIHANEFVFHYPRIGTAWFKDHVTGITTLDEQTESWVDDSKI